MEKKSNNEKAIAKFRKRNKNQDFTLIARDCIGGVLYHQLGLRFLSPTINLFFVPDDFNRFCLHLEDYINGELTECLDHGESYPVGELTPRDESSSLLPVKIHFMHYETYEEAAAKWNQRKERINWNNLFVISSFCYPGETEAFTPKLVEDWNKIPYKKMLFVDREYGFDGEVVMEKPQDCEEYAWLLYAPEESMPFKRVFNQFDFIRFLNKK